MPLPVEQVNYNIVEGSKQGHLVRFNRIAPDLFSALDVPILLGRALHAGECRPTRGRESHAGDAALRRRRVRGSARRYVGRSRASVPDM